MMPERPRRAQLTGSPFSALGDLHFDAPEEYVVDAPDVFAPLGGAQTALSYVNATMPGAAAVQYAQGCQRLLVLGFPFETLRAAERGPVMSAAMAYLDGCNIDTVIDSPEDQGYYRVSPTFSGRASGAGLVRVELQLQRAGDGAYWTGSAWSSAAAWFRGKRDGDVVLHAAGAVRGRLCAARQIHR